MYKAYVTKLTNIRKHPNADRLNLADVFGNTVCVPLDYTEDTIGVYFPTDGQLSEEFCKENDLVRRKDEAGNDAGGYMDPNKRNVTAIRLRGEKSDGLFLPIKCLDYCFKDEAINHLNIGDVIDGAVNDHEICCKYIPKQAGKTSAGGAGTRAHRRAKRSVAPLFFEHADTEQLAYNLSAFKPGDEIEISLKMHGTSQRTGYVPVLKGYKRTILDRILHREGTPIYEYDYICGTRRVVLDRLSQTEDGGFYGTNGFRKQHHDKFVGKLNKGETVYYEVVGFTNTGAPIMGNGKNDKLGKDFVKQYGKETVFSYNCKPVVSIDCDDLQSDIYVYRMTMTNEDGFVVEYTPDFMRFRCEQMGIKCVPVFTKVIIPEYEEFETDTIVEDHCGGTKYLEEEIEVNPGEWVKELAEEFYAGPDPVGETHTREGVVVRIVNRPKFTAYKHKNFEFKVLEGIIKDGASAPDMEEAQEATE
jgi:hypothetical protein